MDAAIEALRPALRDVVKALALEVPQAQVDALLAYLALLQRWNATYNLTAVREPAQMLRQHLADCLAVITPLRRTLGGGPARVLDVGSGGGLPGVVVAILNPALAVTCVDAVGKKAAFVQQVAGELQLRNLRAEHRRVEQLKNEPFNLVTSRAFASLADFAQLTSAQLAPRGVWMAMKGKVPADELAHLPTSVDVFHVEQVTVPGLDAERCIVWMQPKR
ncbi:MAG TPA: 16S rRNA (guanine(527)-N(7))-methyltransferase RsmG [Burkholderiaceae bacterium]|nr:16S rRNA (guanine(527)-N(7))-methyltransferase RsmG [Burkholderiaceae bacterium]